MFSGLSAFPVTPLDQHGVDEKSFIRLIQRLVNAGVDSIGALGSTGGYAYLSRDERARLVRCAVEHAGNVPVMVSIGSLRINDILYLAEDAQQAGISSVLLAPLSYHPFTEEEVYRLYEAVTRHLSVPLCVYDSPSCSGFTFSDALFTRLAQLPNVASLKLLGVSDQVEVAKARVDQLRALLPAHIAIGVSGDATAAASLSAGYDVWYSVVAGLFPELALAITRATQQGSNDQALALSAQLNPLWQLFKQHGSVRVMAAAAELLGLVTSHCLPQPFIALNETDRRLLVQILDQLDIRR